MQGLVFVQRIVLGYIFILRYGMLEDGPPNNIQVLVAGTYVYIAKIDFAGVTKLNIFRWGDYSGLSGWTVYTITSIFIKGR